LSSRSQEVPSLSACSQHYQHKAGINDPWHKCENYQTEDRSESWQKLLGKIKTPMISIKGKILGRTLKTAQHFDVGIAALPEPSI